tara:strand:+ start:274 stop:561 length:288 start_codon:yes stop_codon:yes gene_type:complete
MEPVDSPFDYDASALQVPTDMDFVAVAIPASLLLELDVYVDSMQKHPSCPPAISQLPMWAFRSNVIQAAVRSMLDESEMDELTFMFDWWRDLPEE